MGSLPLVRLLIYPILGWVGLQLQEALWLGFMHDKNKKEKEDRGMLLTPLLDKFKLYIMGGLTIAVAALTIALYVTTATAKR